MKKQDLTKDTFFIFYYLTVLFSGVYGLLAIFYTLFVIAFNSISLNTSMFVVLNGDNLFALVYVILHFMAWKRFHRKKYPKISLLVPKVLLWQFTVFILLGFLGMLAGILSLNVNLSFSYDWLVLLIIALLFSLFEIFVVRELYKKYFVNKLQSEEFKFSLKKFWWFLLGTVILTGISFMEVFSSIEIPSGITLLPMAGYVYLVVKIVKSVK